MHGRAPVGRQRNAIGDGALMSCRPRFLCALRNGSASLAAVQFDEAFAIRPLQVAVSALANVSHPRLRLISHRFRDSDLRPADGLQIRDEVFPVHAPFNRNCAHRASAIAITGSITIAI